jgi:signal transduction histidine kinase
VRERHFGLAGAQERMALAGGRLEVVSRVGVGTTLRATAPLAREASPESSRHLAFPAGRAR